jgi:hypothetical protein
VGTSSRSTRYLSAHRAARLLRCSPEKVERLCKAGAFKGAERGHGGWRIPARAVEAHGGAQQQQEPRVVRPSELALDVEEHRGEVIPIEMARRPVSRGSCEGGPRPCVFVACRHNLYLDVCGSGSLVVNGAAQPEDLESTCALDIAERGPLPVDEVAALLGTTRARVHQIEAQALRKLRAGLAGDFAQVGT